MTVTDREEKGIPMLLPGKMNRQPDEWQPRNDSLFSSDLTGLPRALETGSSISMLLIGLGAIWCLNQRRGLGKASEQNERRSCKETPRLEPV